MKKIILFILLLFPINVFAIKIDSLSAITVNRNTDEILYEKDINKQLPIASLTKIMTTIVSLENIKDLNETITITDNDINNLLGYQTIGLKVNDIITYEELLYSTMMYSAADSAQALSNHIFDNKDKFIDKMNELANKIEMNNTHFSNSVGKDENNYSTSFDLYKLIDYALNNKNFYKIYTTKNYTIKSLNKTINNNVNNIIKQNNLENNNIKIDGYKGGYTNKSGLSFSGISNIDNNEIIVITLNAIDNIDTNKHIIDSLEILNYIKDNYSNRVILESNKLVDNIVYKDNKKERNYEIKSNSTIKYFLKNDINLNYLKVFYEGITVIDNSIKENDKLGSIKIFYEDKLLSEVPVKFNKKYIVKETKDYTNLIIFLCICIVGLIVFKPKRKR